MNTVYLVSVPVHAGYMEAPTLSLQTTQKPVMNYSTNLKWFAEQSLQGAAINIHIVLFHN